MPSDTRTLGVSKVNEGPHVRGCSGQRTTWGFESLGVENGARVMPVLGLRVHTYCAPCRSSTVQLSSAKSSRDSSVSSVPPTSRRRHAASRHACITRRRTQSHAATRTAIAHRSGRSRLGRGQGTLAVEGRYGSTSAHSSNSCITAARTPQDNTLAGGRGAKEGAPQASAAKGEKWGRRELRWPTSGRCSHSTRRHCACSVPILSRVVQRTTCTRLMKGELGTSRTIPAFPNRVP